VNWEALGAIAEVTGVIAIVISLLYLARQVKEGNDLNRTNTFREIMYGMINHNNVMFGPENAELVTRGFKSFASLPPVDKIRFAHLMTSYFQFPEDSWNSAQVGLLGDDTMENWSWYLRTQFFPYDGVQEWWSEYKSVYAPDFQIWMDKVAAAANRNEDPFGIADS